MTKAKILTIEGKESKEIELPKLFSENVREDICQKTFETEKKIQPYSNFYLAGKLHSASGKLKHGRRLWKTEYGKGLSRIPRKILWRRGTQFYWIGASVNSTRGGRAAHPPRIEHFLRKKKINKKERKIALFSGLIATASMNYLKKRYSSLENKKIELKLPLIVESRVLKLKTKEFLDVLKKFLNEFYDVAIKKREIRAGKGKARGRKYKKSAGLLFIIGKDENFKIKGIDVRKINEIKISDLYPLGRLALYTEQAVKELAERWEEKK